VNRVLVTGASGALGRAFVEHLARLGCEIVAIGRQAASGSPPTIQCDIRDQAALATAVTRAAPDVIVHLAATFAGSLAEAYATNVAPAQHLLELMESTRSGGRIVLVGSAAEYGVVLPEENPVREDRVLAPVSVYGLSKAWQTQLASYYAARGVNVVCARIFNLIGPGVSNSLFAGRVQNQIDEVKLGRRSVVEVGSLTAVRDYLSTKAAARLLYLIALKGNAGAVYHVASGKPTVMRDLLLQQLEAHGLDSSVVRESPSLSNRTGYDVPRIYADITKTMKLDSASATHV
jgi:nucleoside-diphosphate-sugar epimerase